jgi:Protein of unknown function (DUF3515)
VATPSPKAQAGVACDHLHAALPRRVDGRLTSAVSPSSTLTAAWGKPAVVLRCGVGRPRGLRPTSDVINVNGVLWFLHQTHDAYVFTTYGRVAFVEVSVPASVPRERATAPLVDLARPVITSVPTTQDASQGP